MAGNLRIDDIDHPYWTSRAGNALRFALWHERRRHAAPYLRMIAPHFDEADAKRLRAAADSFEKETAALAELTALLPIGGDERAHWEEENIAAAEKLLGEARVRDEAGMAALEEVVRVDFGVFANADADALQKLVADDDLLVSEAALSGLVRLAPEDLGQRLAALFASEPDARKKRADGPIHRQILWALSHVEGAAATEAIGKAVFFPGESDAVPEAISGWAAELLWDRKGKESRERFLSALDSEIPHVVNLGLKYVGRCGNPEDLARLKELDLPAAYAARIRLGDETAYPALFAVLATPAWWEAYSSLRDLGPRVEPHAIPMLNSPDPRVVHYVGILLSRVGTKKSVAPLEKACAKYPGAGRLRQALEDLKKRIGK